MHRRSRDSSAQVPTASSAGISTKATGARVGSSSPIERTDAGAEADLATYPSSMPTKRIDTIFVPEGMEDEVGLTHRDSR